MSKLIIEMEMNGIPDCCGLCDPLFTVVCATKHDQTIDKMMLRAGRPSWCPIAGVLPEEHGDLIDRDVASEAFTRTFDEWDRDVAVFSANGVVGVLKSQQAVIAAERKDDEQIH